MDRKLCNKFYTLKTDVRYEMGKMFQLLSKVKKGEEDPWIKILKELNERVKTCYLEIGTRTALCKLKDNIKKMEYCVIALQKQNMSM